MEENTQNQEVNFESRIDLSGLQESVTKIKEQDRKSVV